MRGRGYLYLAILGGIIPFAQLAWFLAEHGADRDRFFAPLRENSWGLILIVDLLLAAIIFLAWSWRDSRRHGVRGWPIVLVLCVLVALSCAMPLYFWLRERPRASGA